MQIADAEMREELAELDGGPRPRGMQTLELLSLETDEVNAKSPVGPARVRRRSSKPPVPRQRSLKSSRGSDF